MKTANLAGTSFSKRRLSLSRKITKENGTTWLPWSSKSQFSIEGMDFQSTTTAAKFYNPKKSRKVTFTMQQQK